MRTDEKLNHFHVMLHNDVFCGLSVMGIEFEDGKVLQWDGALIKSPDIEDQTVIVI